MTDKTDEKSKEQNGFLKCCGKILHLKLRYKILLILALLICGGVWYVLHTDWQSVVRSLVHKYGSEAVGTDVSIGKINLSLLDGKGGVSDIEVANPKGYSSENIIRLGNVSVSVDIKSLSKNTIVINEIRVDKPEVTYEILDLQHNNVKDILANLQKNSSSTAETKSTETDSSSSKQVAIKKVTISGGAVTVMSNLLGGTQSLSANLPTINIKNIGSENQGVSIEDGLSRIFKELLNSTTKIVSGMDLSSLTGSLKDVASGAAETAEDAAKGVGEAAKSVGSGVTDGLKSVGDGVGSLFK